MDPNKAADINDGIFGLGSSLKKSKLIYIPVPWEATTSYGAGTANGPRAILQASMQQDLFDADIHNPYEAGMYLLPEEKLIRDLNRRACLLSRKKKVSTADIKNVNVISQKVNQAVFDQTLKLLDNDKIVAVIGGDHSSPFGAIRAIGSRYQKFGILHIDAHMDLRKAYQGYEHSHASIMYNVLKNVPSVTKLVQVGLRDYCQEEVDFALGQNQRVEQFTDLFLQKEKFSDRSWKDIIDEIIDPLPEFVWVSFDIDGLEPTLCPNTGTPVPGGLSFAEALFLISSMVRMGHKIIGFDLCEVSPGKDKKSEWDANVGMRLLYKLSSWTLASLGYARIKG